MRFMTLPLENVTVGIAEHRYTKEFSTLFERLGAEVYACPLIEETPVQNREELQEFIRVVVSGNLDFMIFLTGVGARMLVAEAESIGQKESFLDALARLLVVARGPKPQVALRQLGVRIDISPEIPTSEGVIEALRSKELSGQRVGVQLYGTPNPLLVSALEGRGADVKTVQVYSYGIVADLTAVDALIEKVLNNEIQVLAFTSAPQVRTLFDGAGQLGKTEALQKSLNDGVIVAAIGDVTRRTLKERGVAPKIIPKQPKMGPFAQAIAEFLTTPNCRGGL